MTYPNLTDEEIQKLGDAINTLGNMKSDIRKAKLKVFGKSLLSLVIVAGGVALTIAFPSPIVIAALGGAATLIAGNNGILSKTKKIKEKEKEKKKSKEEVKNAVDNIRIALRVMEMLTEINNTKVANKNVKDIALEMLNRALPAVGDEELTSVSDEDSDGDESCPTCDSD